MGYSKSKISVERCKDLLQHLAKAEADVSVRSTDPFKLAYKVREALRVAKLYPQTYPDFQNLGEKFVIKSKQDKVVFELRHSIVTNAIVELAQSLTLNLPECKSIFEIIGALVKHKPVEVEFPNAGITGQLDVLYNWTSKNGYYINNVTPLVISKTETKESWNPKK